MQDFSHKLAISLINVILVAKKALEADLINSEALLDVLMYCVCNYTGTRV